MKILLFLGSGISRPSGVSSVEDIDEALFREEWVHHSGYYFVAKRPEQAPEREIDAKRVQEFLQILKTEISGYFLSKGMQPSYEDLYYACVQVRDEIAGTVHNPIALGFVEALRARVAHLFRVGNGLDSDIGLAELSNGGIGLIESVVRLKLSQPRIPKGLDLISNWANLVNESKIERLDICTLNHDLLVETQLDLHSVTFEDGFGRWDGDYRWSDTALFDRTDAKVRLMKLHGSVDWFELAYDHGNTYFLRLGKHSAAKHIFDCRAENGTNWTPLIGQPQLLSGTYNKLNEYLYGVYAELRLRFMKALDECEIVVMSGYGWNDPGINRIFTRWLWDSAAHRIVLLHKDPEELARSSRGFPRYQSRDLEARQQLLVERYWLEYADPDTLLQVVKNAIRMDPIPQKRVYTIDELFQ